MSELASSLHNDKRLQTVIAEVSAVIAETVSMISARDVRVIPKQRGSILDIEGWLWLLTQPKAFVDAVLTGEHWGKGFGLAMDETEAVTLAATLREAPDIVIEEHRRAGLRDWHEAAFDEVCQLLCQALEHVVHEVLGGQVGLERRRTGLVRPGYDPAGILGEGDRVIYDLAIEIADFPAAELQLILDPAAATLCNGGEDPVALPVTEDLTPAPAEALESIPAAPIRGQLRAFVGSQELNQVLRCAGRRIGLEIDRRPRTEIPNPAAFGDELLLIEIQVGEERRFDWAKRLKQQNPGLAVTLLIHEPSRARVIRGLLTKADLVLAWPCKETQLSAKLGKLLDEKQGGDDA